MARWCRAAWNLGFTGVQVLVLQSGWMLLSLQALAAEPPSRAISSSASVQLGQPSASELESMSVFGEKLAKAISKGDTNQLAQLCDYPAMWEAITQDIQAPEVNLMRAKLAFLRGMKQSPGGIFREGLGKELKWMRVRERDGEPVLLLRMRMGENSGATYLEVFLTREASGDYRVRDFYNYAMGERVSGILSRLVAKEISVESKSPLESLFRGKNTAAKEMLLTIEFFDLLQKGQYRAVLDRTDALPPGIRKERLIQFMRVRAATALRDEARFLEVLDEVSATFSNDPSLGLILIDRYFLKKEYTKALEIVNRLILDLGRDAFLSTLEASNLSELGRSKEALEAVEAGLKVEEGDLSLLWSRVNLQSKAKHYGEVARTLDEILRRHRQFANPADPQTYGLKDFFASPEGIDYVARLKRLKQP